MTSRITKVRDDAGDNVEIVSSVNLPTASIGSDRERDDAVPPEGLPIIDEKKHAAFPHQDDVVAICHEYARHRANGFWGEFEPLLLNQFDSFNAEHFFEKLPKTEIKLGQCSSPRTVLGEYALRGDHGMLSEITINWRLCVNKVNGIILEDRTRTGFLRFIDDILLHEMVHMYCDRALSRPELSYRGHGPVFATECNRIGAKFGLAPVRHAKSKKKIEAHMHRCNQWPHCVRDPAYYLGAMVDEPELVEPDDEVAARLDDGSVGPAEMLGRLLALAKRATNTPEDLQVLAKALIAGLRLVAQTPGLLPQFPADLVSPPGPTQACTAA